VARVKYAKYNVVLDTPLPWWRQPVPDGWQTVERERWPHLELCDGARVVDASFVEGIFERETTRPRSWTGFYAAFPDAMGLYKISQPAFAPDGSTAVVPIEHTCDVLCGTGTLVELRKRNGRWRVVRREGTWIS